MESLDFKAARCLRSHLDQTIHFRVRDTKARQGRDGPKVIQLAKGRAKIESYSFWFPDQGFPLQYLRGSSQQRILFGGRRFLLGSETYFHLRSNSCLSNMVGGLVGKTMK